MGRQLRASIVLTLLTALLLGGAYPALVTVVAAVCFRRQADGSLIVRDGRLLGSRLIGQSFSSPRYFHGRPSAAGHGYDPLASGGSNLGPTSKALALRLAEATRTLETEDGGKPPVDLITASASGLDPDISPAAARYQVARVARTRGLSSARLQSLVDQHIAHRTLGLLGEPRVNVLELNLALDRMEQP